MRIYNFEISGKVKTGDSNGDIVKTPEDPPERKTMLKILWDKIWEIIYILFLILGLLLPEGSFLELLYRLHKIAIYSIIPLLIIKEIILIMRWVKARKDKEKIETSKLLKDMLIGLLVFLILFFLNLGVYKKVVGPKLTTVEILSPKNGDKISRPTIEVKVFVRNVELPLYLIVETPQGTQWIQSKRYIQHNKFKDTLTQEVRLGEGYIGIGEEFKIFAIGAKEDLEIGILEKIPPHSIVSNTVAVKKVK